MKNQLIEFDGVQVNQSRSQSWDHSIIKPINQSVVSTKSVCFVTIRWHNFQVPRAVLYDKNEKNNQLYIHATAVTVTKEAVEVDLATNGRESYSDRHGGRIPPPKGSYGGDSHYGSLHGDGTTAKNEVARFVNGIATELAVSQKNLDEWKDRTGIRVKLISEHNIVKVAVRAGLMLKLIRRISESRSGLLSETVWTGSSLLEHVQVMINDWFKIYAESHLISQVYDQFLSSLTSRTVLPLVSLSQEIVSAFGNARSITYSMNFYR